MAEAIDPSPNDIDNDPDAFEGFANKLDAGCKEPKPPEPLTKPSGPSGPCGPAGHCDPVDPAGPCDPSGPIEPVEPVAPLAPCNDIVHELTDIGGDVGYAASTFTTITEPEYYVIAPST